MAWDEILNLQEGPREEKPSPAKTEVRDQVSLIRQAAEMVGRSGETDILSREPEDEESFCCPDGYVRRSPVQTYLTAPDYQTRRIRKAVLIVVGIGLAVLLALALVRAGMLRF